MEAINIFSKVEEGEGLKLQGDVYFKLKLCERKRINFCIFLEEGRRKWESKEKELNKESVKGIKVDLSYVLLSNEECLLQQLSESLSHSLSLKIERGDGINFHIFREKRFLFSINTKENIARFIEEDGTVDIEELKGEVIAVVRNESDAKVLVKDQPEREKRLVRVKGKVRWAIVETSS